MTLITILRKATFVNSCVKDFVTTQLLLIVNQKCLVIHAQGFISMSNLLFQNDLK